MLIEAEYINNEPIIHHFYRKDGKRVHNIIRGFKPYFYVPEEEKIPPNVPGHFEVIGVERGFKNIKGKPVKKVICKTPNCVKNIRDMFSLTYESDIPYTQRWVIDTEPSFGDQPSILFIDIEVWDKNGFPKPEDAKYPILCISAYSDHLKKFWTLVFNGREGTEERTRGKYPWLIRFYKREEDLILGLVSLVRFVDPEVISGWNVCRFDFEYLMNRSKNLNVNISSLSPLGKIKSTFIRPGLLNKREKYRSPADIAGRIIFDALTAYKRIQRKGIDSYSLDSVSQKELGKSKETGKRVCEMTEPEMIEYNVHDVELVKEIEEKRNVISYFFGMSDFIKCPITHTESFSRMADNYMLRKKGEMVFPNTKITPSETFEGGRVFDPPRGRYDNVVVFDLTSLYPSIIMSMNMSIETVCQKEDGDIHVDDLDVHIKSHPEGFVPKVMRHLFDERDKYRNILESGLYKRGTDDWLLAWNKSEYVKQLANAIYGLFAYKGFRLYVPKLSETTTYMGRKILDWTKKVGEKNGYKAIYGDTDSVFFVGFSGKNPDEIIKEAEVLRDKITNSYSEFMSQFGVKKHRLSIKCEELFDNVTFVGNKKRYFGKMIYKRGERVDLLEVVGFETRRSDSSAFTKDFQKSFMQMVCDKKPREVLTKFIKDKMVEMRNKPIMEIAFPKAIVMDITKYKVKTNVIKGAEYANAFLGKHYDSGDKPRFVYIKKVRPGLPKVYKGHIVDGVCFDEPKDIDGFEIDYDRMAELQIYRKVHNIMKALGYKMPPLDPNQQVLVCE